MATDMALSPEGTKLLGRVLDPTKRGLYGLSAEGKTYIEGRFRR